jgi:hypothetical protein
VCVDFTVQFLYGDSIKTQVSDLYKQQRTIIHSVGTFRG